MQKANRIYVRLKTPIWTGNAKGYCDVLKETSLTGSIRWWFRTMLRSKGIYCGRDSKFESVDYKKQIYSDTDLFFDQTEMGFKRRVEAQLRSLSCGCPDCLMFGTTGWKRQLTIRAIGKGRVETKELQNLKGVTSTGTELMGRKVFYSKECLELEVINSRSVDTDYYFSILVYLLSEISKYGGLGAKTQKGFGVFEVAKVIKNGKVVKVEDLITEGRKLLSDIISIVKKIGTNEEYSKAHNFPNAPMLNEMLFTKYRLTNDQLINFVNRLLEKNGDNSIPPEVFGRKFTDYQLTSFIIRHFLRKKFPTDANTLFGSKNPMRGSRFNFSGVFKVENGLWEMRFWSWLEKENETGKTNEKLHKDCNNELLKLYSGMSNFIEIDELWKSK